MIHWIGRRRDAAHTDRLATPTRRRAHRALATTLLAGAAAIVLWPSAATLDTTGRDRLAETRIHPDAAPPLGALAPLPGLTVVPIPPAAPAPQIAPGATPGASPQTSPDTRIAKAAVPGTVLLMPGGSRPRLGFDAAREPRGPTAGAKAAATERERAMARELAALRQQLDAERAKLAALYRGKAPVFSILDKQSRQGVAQAEKVIAMTGLDVDALLAGEKSARNTAQTAARTRTLTPAVHPDGSQAFDAAAQAITSRVDRWRRLQAVLRRLPLIAPLDHYRKTSEYGDRKHPITKRVTKHNGTDFAYYTGAPVRATAAGTVVFAGRRGGFGNLVEIDHGQGLRTRYAHLHKPMVKKGDAVVFRQQIGQLGSTGRSTGPHVHYEILVRGRAVDPMRFVTAGKYAFKPVPKAELVAVKPEDEKRDGKAFRAASAKAKVDVRPKPRAAASMIDRPDSFAWPGIVAHPGTAIAANRPAAAPAPAKADPAPGDPSPDAPAGLDLSGSRIYAAGLLPSLRPRKRITRKRVQRRRVYRKRTRSSRARRRAR